MLSLYERNRVAVAQLDREAAAAAGTSATSAATDPKAGGGKHAFRRAASSGASSVSSSASVTPPRTRFLLRFTRLLAILDTKINVVRANTRSF